MLGPLRFPLKTLGFVGWTFGLYGLLEAETLLRPDPGLVSQWQGRYGRGLLKIWGIELDAHGPGLGPQGYPSADPRGVGHLFVMNHRSALDIFVALASTQSTLVSRADLAAWPVIGVAARRVGTLFVDRQSRRSGATVVKAMEKALQAGRGVMVFPEGTTFEGDAVRPFHPGAFHAAVRADARVVPLGLCYERTDASFGDEDFSTHMKRLGSQKTIRAALVAGEPIPSQGLRPDALCEQVHRKVQALVNAARARVGGPA